MALGGTGRIPGTVNAAALARLSATYRRAPNRINAVRLSELSNQAQRGGLSAIRRVGQGTFQTWPMPPKNKSDAVRRAFYKPSWLLSQAQAGSIRQILARRVLWRA